MTPRRAPIPFVPPAPKAEEAVRSGNRPVYIRQNVSTEENHRLREMPFDELQKQVRAGQNRGRDYR